MPMLEEQEAGGGGAELDLSFLIKEIRSVKEVRFFQLLEVLCTSSSFK